MKLQETRALKQARVCVQLRKVTTSSFQRYESGGSGEHHRCVLVASSLHNYLPGSLKCQLKWGVKKAERDLAQILLAEFELGAE